MKVLTGCRTAGRCVLMPRLSSVLEGVPNAKFTEKSVAPAEVAPAAALRPDCATVHTSLALEPAQLSHTVLKQRLTSVLLPHLLREPSINGRASGVGDWAALHRVKVFPGLAAAVS